MTLWEQPRPTTQTCFKYFLAPFVSAGQRPFISKVIYRADAHHMSWIVSRDELMLAYHIQYRKKKTIAIAILCSWTS
jgi:hypothetical protein